MTLLLAGCLTWYAYTGGPLRCGGTFDPAEDWIAVDIDALPGWRCNDLVRVTVGDDVMLLPVRDSGPLSRYCVYFGDTCVPIVGDLPAHSFPWPVRSVRGVIENVTAGLRQVGELDRTEDRQEVKR